MKPTDNQRIADAIIELFAAQGTYFQQQHLVAYGKVCRGLTADDVVRGCARAMRDPSRSKPPTAAQLRQICLSERPGYQGAVEDAQAPTPGHQPAIVANLMNFGDGEEEMICGGCGAAFRHMVGYRQRLAQLREGVDDAPLLCTKCVGQHLENVGRERAHQASVAWPILVNLTRNDVRPSSRQAAMLREWGFGAELNSRLAKAGMLSGRRAER